MSDYSVAPIKRHWRNWEKLADLAHVSFSEDQLALGKEILNHKANIYPVAKPRVVHVREYFGPSCPSDEYPRGFSFDSRKQMVHPVILLTLLTGIRKEEETGHRQWTYRTVASTYLLSHPNGKVFTFMVDGGTEQEIRWQGKFLLAGTWIGRSMYIYGYKHDRIVHDGFNQSHFFVPDADGVYGKSCTLF